MTKTKKDFIDLSQFNQEELNFLVESSLERKAKAQSKGKGSIDSDDCGKNKIFGCASF